MYGSHDLRNAGALSKSFDFSSLFFSVISSFLGPSLDTLPILYILSLFNSGMKSRLFRQTFSNQELSSPIVWCSGTPLTIILRAFLLRIYLEKDIVARFRFSFNRGARRRHPLVK